MKREKTRRGSRARACLVLCAAVACGKAGNPTTLTSSSSNWLRCASDPECVVHEAGAYCGSQGYCLDTAGEPLSSAPDTALEGADTELPEGGSVLRRATLNGMRQMVVDESGVIWFLACEGLFAIQGDEIRRYSWVDSPLPQRVLDLQLLVDAQNRTWIASGTALQVIEAGEFRTIFEGNLAFFSVSRDGRVWVSGTDVTTESERAWVRQVSPVLGEEIEAPRFGVGSIAAGPEGALWVGTDAGAYLWADGGWSGPFGSDVLFIHYDPRQDVFSSSFSRLRWNGSELEQEPFFLDPSPYYGQHVGFDATGRLITVDDTAVRWIAGGQVADAVPLSNFGPIPATAVGPGGVLYFAGETAISRLDGTALSRVIDLSRFDPDVEFRWRAQPFGQILREPSRVVTGAELAAPGAELIGTKLHARGIAFGGFENAGVQVEGEVIPGTWADAAGEFSTFMSERGLSPFVDVSGNDPLLEGAGNAPTGNEPPSDLYGYLETGTCFGQDISQTRQFWVVEVYPADMPETERQALESELRERYAVPKQ